MNFTTESDFAPLLAAAKDALVHAYVPYSHYPVGAAAWTVDGRLITGANVENASYGLTLCAECSLISALHMGGGGKLAAFTCVNGDGQVIMPCGRCRQLLVEHGGPDLVLLTVSGVKTMAQVLPDAFTQQDMEDYR
jgi:cytidine deaminase